MLYLAAVQMWSLDSAATCRLAGYIRPINLFIERYNETAEEFRCITCLAEQNDRCLRPPVATNICTVYTVHTSYSTRMTRSLIVLYSINALIYYF